MRGRASVDAGQDSGEERDDMSNEATFTAWAAEKFGPAADTGIPQTERFASYFECWMAAQNHVAQHRNMVKLIADVERCYQMLLTEANAKAALFKAEEILRAALADAKELKP
jgi:hypothetical protein